MEILSPRSANVQPKPRTNMTKSEPKTKSKTESTSKTKDLPNPPPSVVREPGYNGEVYHTSHKLGQGGFACCYSGTLHRNSRVFAMKIVKTKMQHRKMQEKFRTELQIHSKMRHPNIVEFFRAFSFGENTYVVLELCSNGSLMEMVKARKQLCLPEVRRFMIQLCGGVKYMHQRAVIHRDLKMGNLFLDSAMNLKIGDFGLAAIVLTDKERRQTLCGTPNYIAPEILEKGEGHTHKVDTWAIGVICFAMLTGSPPFVSKTQEDIYRKVKSKDYAWPIDCPNFIPQPAKELVGACLTLSPKDRPEMDDLVELSFFKGGCIASELDITCKKAKPSWLKNEDPRGDRVEPGHDVGHERICAECGVGRDSRGRARPTVGENANRTAIAECEMEKAQGLTPQFPIPSDMVYKQYAAEKEDWSVARAYGVPRGETVTSEKARPNLPPAHPRREDLQALEHDPKYLFVLEQPPQNKTAAPTGTIRREVQSFAAMQRQQYRPSKARTVRPRGVQIQPDTQSTAETPLEPSKSRELLRDLPVRAATQTSHPTLRRLRSQDVADRLPRSNPTTGSFNQASAPAVMTVNPHTKPDDDENPKMAKASASKDVGLEGSQSVRTKRATSTSKTRNAVETVPVKSPRKTAKERPPGLEKTLSDGDLPAAPETTFSVEGKLISPNENSQIVPSSKPNEVVTSLQRLLDCLEGRGSKAKSRAQSSRLRTHPIVEKWVDYTNKYGIGYVLNDNTVGCVVKVKGKPSSCIVIRNGKEHYIARSKTPEKVDFVPQNSTPLEFYENVGEDGMRQLLEQCEKFKLNLAKGEDMISLSHRLSSRYDDEKLRLIVLCDKFGKYMIKSLGSDVEQWNQSTKPRVEGGKFVKFYQRIGNLGIWGFGDGGFQFNFPDHTKLVISQGGSWIDYYYIQADDAKFLLETKTLQVGTLENRDRLSLPTAELLEMRTAAARKHELMLKYNQFQRKLDFVGTVVSAWIDNGGLGQLGNEKDAHRISWTGLAEEGHIRRQKLVWVTVGAFPKEMEYSVVSTERDLSSEDAE